MLRQARLTLCQQIGLLMLVAQKPLRRRIALPENDMPDDTETRRFPCLEKQVDLVPAVKADAQAPIFQNAVHLIERWLKPTTVIVVDDGVTLAGLVTGDIGRVGQNERSEEQTSELQSLMRISYAVLY